MQPITESTCPTNRCSLYLHSCLLVLIFILVIVCRWFVIEMMLLCKKASVQHEPRVGLKVRLFCFPGSGQGHHLQGNKGADSTSCDAWWESATGASSFLSCVVNQTHLLMCCWGSELITSDRTLKLRDYFMINTACQCLVFPSGFHSGSGGKASEIVTWHLMITKLHVKVLH